jgi:hypothetical protein
MQYGWNVQQEMGKHMQRTTLDEAMMLWYLFDHHQRLGNQSSIWLFLFFTFTNGTLTINH